MDSSNVINKTWIFLRIGNSVRKCFCSVGYDLVSVARVLNTPLRNKNFLFRYFSFLLSLIFFFFFFSVSIPRFPFLIKRCTGYTQEQRKESGKKERKKRVRNGNTCSNSDKSTKMKGKKRFF